MEAAPVDVAIHIRKYSLLAGHFGAAVLGPCSAEVFLAVVSIQYFFVSVILFI